MQAATATIVQGGNGRKDVRTSSDLQVLPGSGGPSPSGRNLPVDLPMVPELCKKGLLCRKVDQ